MCVCVRGVYVCARVLFVFGMPLCLCEGVRHSAGEIENSGRSKAGSLSCQSSSRWLRMGGAGEGGQVS